MKPTGSHWVKLPSGFSGRRSFQRDFFGNPPLETYGLAPPKRPLQKSDGARMFQTPGSIGICKNSDVALGGCVELLGRVLLIVWWLCYYALLRGVAARGEVW